MFEQKNEAHFTLVGCVNKQFCRIWGSEHPQVIEVRPLHPEKVTVWCSLWTEVVIGTYFFDNDDRIIVLPDIEEYDLENM